mgnify:CR=1 FL=1
MNGHKEEKLDEWIERMKDLGRKAMRLETLTDRWIKKDG